MPRPREIARRIAESRPDAIHIATEGPIGHLVRRYCLARRLPFTTSLHTRFAEYLSARWPVPQRLSWAWLRWFHNAGRGTMVSTASLARELRARGFRAVLRWPRGVDSRLFHPGRARDLGLPRPVFLAVGRVAVEKNIEASLALDLPGTKLVVGDGPARPDSGAAAFPDAVFHGTKRGAELAAIYAGADVFQCFRAGPTPSVLCCSRRSRAACRSPDFRWRRPTTSSTTDRSPRSTRICVPPASQAVCSSRPMCRQYAEAATWEASAQCFIGNLVPATGIRSPPTAAGEVAPLRQRAEILQ